jgi:hypothetical protein
MYVTFFRNILGYDLHLMFEYKLICILEFKLFYISGALHKL